MLGTVNVVHISNDIFNKYFPCTIGPSIKPLSKGTACTVLISPAFINHNQFYIYNIL